MPSAFSKESVSGADIRVQFDSLLEMLRATKPNDRSEVDRYRAIVITEVEKAKAIYLVYGQKAGE